MFQKEPRKTALSRNQQQNGGDMQRSDRNQQQNCGDMQRSARNQQENGGDSWFDPKSIFSDASFL